MFVTRMTLDNDQIKILPKAFSASLAPYLVDFSYALPEYFMLKNAHCNLTKKTCFYMQCEFLYDSSVNMTF